MASTAVAGIALPAESACFHGEPHDDDRGVAQSSGALAESASLHEVVRLATLAASSHNTQPWKFWLEARSITVLPDFSRRCPIVDPDDHHLFVSLGCATENLVHAAPAAALHADVAVMNDRIEVGLTSTASVRSPLLEAIPKRQCSRSIYDGHAVPSAELRSLERSGRGRGVDVILLTEKAQIETVLEYVTRGNTLQIEDSAFVAELESWIRFNQGEAARAGDGLFSRSTGNPALPRWLGTLLFRQFLTAKSENDKCAAQMRSSAGVVIFTSDANDRAHWMEVGRCYERFALEATALGIRNAFLNQPVEVPALRTQLATWLDIGDRRPDLVVRFGRGPEMPRSPRRPVENVLI